MQTPSIDGLVAFINSQPADRPIKSHSSWNECAVGDYAREVLGHDIPLARTGDSYIPVHNDEVLNALWRECGTCEPLNMAARYQVIPQTDGPSLMDILSRMKQPASYGELVQVLNDPDTYL